MIGWVTIRRLNKRQNHINIRSGKSRLVQDAGHGKHRKARFCHAMIPTAPEGGITRETVHLDADLGHVGPTGADGTAEATASFLGGEEQGNGGAGEEEPHEGGAGLDLTATLLGVTGAVADPVVGERRGIDIAAIGGAQLGGQDDGIDKGEESDQGVQRQHDDGAA